MSDEITVSGNLERYFGERRESAAGGVSSETDYMNLTEENTKLLREFLSKYRREAHL